jgi:hypothetical protein
MHYLYGIMGGLGQYDNAVKRAKKTHRKILKETCLSRWEPPSMHKIMFSLPPSPDSGL